MLNLYFQEGAVPALNKLNLDTKQITYVDAIVEMANLPLTCVATVADRMVSLQVYMRDENLSRTNLYRSGTFPIDGETAPEDKTMMLYMLTLRLALSYLQKCGVLEQCAELDENRHGILFYPGEDGIGVCPVSGDDRPELKCVLAAGGTAMRKPYPALPEPVAHTAAEEAEHDGIADDPQQAPQEEAPQPEENALARFEEEEAAHILESSNEPEEAPIAWKATSHLLGLGYWGENFDSETEIVSGEEEVAGTQYEGRTQRIEHLQVGDPVLLVREPDNEADPMTISVRNSQGQSLGNFPANKSAALAPLMDRGYVKAITASVSEVVPLSQRGPRAKKAILRISVQIQFENLIQCTLCKLGGDQVHVWAQELHVYGCTMPLEDVKALFELYNRSCGEYDNLDEGKNDTSYAGLDNLEEEIRTAREKMQSQRIPGLDYSAGNREECRDFGTYVLQKIAQEPQRYGHLADYEISEYANLDEILEGYCLGEKTYYWLDQTRVSEEEYTECRDYNHWYEVMELFPGKTLPVDMNDEDVVSIFGCGSFEAFADLYYGC